MNQRVKTILIIRFSSFGDIIQSLSAVIAFKKSNMFSRVVFLTKLEFREIVESCPYVDDVIIFDKKSGIKGLINVAFCIKKLRIDLLYDAHNNLRTFIIKLVNIKMKKYIRSKSRIKRILLFKFRKNLFEKPFRGSISYLKPISTELENLEILPEKSNLIFNNSIPIDHKNKIVLCPSAAWDSKCWPVEKWNQLIALFINQTNENILILGGPQDHFCKNFEKISNRVLNLAGKLTLIESCQVILNSKFVISGDTGLIHVADLLGVKGIELIGPSAFGYTVSSSIHIIEKNLECKPCSKDGSDKCTNNIYKKCLEDINVWEVFDFYKKFI